MLNSILILTVLNFLVLSTILAIIIGFLLKKNQEFDSTRFVDQLVDQLGLNKKEDTGVIDGLSKDMPEGVYDVRDAISYYEEHPEIDMPEWIQRIKDKEDNE